MEVTLRRILQRDDGYILREAIEDQDLGTLSHTGTFNVSLKGSEDPLGKRQR